MENDAAVQAKLMTAELFPFHVVLSRQARRVRQDGYVEWELRGRGRPTGTLAVTW